MADKTVQLDRKVPDFALPATGGGNWKLSGQAGRRLVVYFYPRDNTSGCTREGMERKFQGVERSTFLIDEKGVLRREWRKVRVAGHAEAVLDAAREL